MESSESTKEQVLEFLQNRHTGVLSTVDTEGNPASAVVFYKINTQFELSMIMRADSAKAQNMAEHPEIAFVVFSDTVGKINSVQLKGSAQKITEPSAHQEIVESFMKNISQKTPYFLPFAHSSGAPLACFLIKPTWLQWLGIDDGTIAQSARLEFNSK